MSLDGLMALAASQLGTREEPAGSNRQKYGKWYGADGQPWCAMFVSWCLHHSDQRLVITTDKGFAYCPYGVAYFKGKKRWSETGKRGDLVFYSFAGERADHVGLVERVFENGSIQAIEGNTGVYDQNNGGEVMRRVRLASILGYGRPLWPVPKPAVSVGQSSPRPSVAPQTRP